MRLRLAPAVFLLAALPAAAQLVPNDAKEPVEVIKPRGEFAAKLNGAVMPVGKGWKVVGDRERLFQLTVPDKWKVLPDPEGEAVLRVAPPTKEKEPRAALTVYFKTPSDADPLAVDEEFALSYVDEVTEMEPALKQLQFKPTDAGFVIARGQRFALAGGTLRLGPNAKQLETYRMQQLVYISEDRIVSVQFVTPEKDFARYADELARIFASYQDVGFRKEGE
jgi:hypothetical protein